MWYAHSMSTKYKTILTLLIVAGVCILSGLSVTLFSAVLNIVLLLVGLIAFFLSIGAFAFAKKTDERVSQVLKRAVEGLLNFGF